MTLKNKSIINLKSSEKLSHFLEKTQLHKKDLAEMIGVTLSYIYNLIDETIPFSTRSTTLERIATVMDIEPEEFVEYKIPQEPIYIDESISYIKNKIRDKGYTTVQFLKSFPRRKRVEIVDILRGAEPLPLDWKELNSICQILDIKEANIYPFWEHRLKNVLKIAGMNLSANQGLIDSMFECAQKYIKDFKIIDRKD